MTEDAPTGPLWQIEARKYDGSQHYRLPAFLVTDDGGLLVFQAQVGGEIVHRTHGTKTIPRPFDMIFWREAWYNVYLNYADSGALDHFYCNVALPPEVSQAGKTLTFIDLDLDVRIWPDGSYTILDAGEFRDHCALYAYPPEIKQRAPAALLDIIARWRARHFPFDRLVDGGQ